MDKPEPITVVGLLPYQERIVAKALPKLNLRFLSADSVSHTLNGTIVLVTKFIGHRMDQRARAKGARVVLHRGGIKTLIAALPAVAAG